jgi:hypothetical protein
LTEVLVQTEIQTELTVVLLVHDELGQVERLLPCVLLVKLVVPSLDGEPGLVIESLRFKSVAIISDSNNDNDNMIFRGGAWIHEEGSKVHLDIKAKQLRTYRYKGHFALDISPWTSRPGGQLAPITIPPSFPPLTLPEKSGELTYSISLE